MDAITKMSAAFAPYLGIIGVLIGALLNEFIRRSNRREQFSATIFAKRLDAYEKLLGVLQEGSEIAYEVMENSKLTAQERHDLISVAIHKVAKHVDTHDLYIDQEIGANSVALFMGVEDVQAAEQSEQADLKQRFYDGR
jgi:hypothetical protein